MSEKDNMDDYESDDWKRLPVEPDYVFVEEDDEYWDDEKNRARVDPDNPPGRIWYDPPWKLYLWPLCRPFYFAGDEYLRRTFVIHLPLLGRVVVAISDVDYFTWDGEKREKE